MKIAALGSALALLATLTACNGASADNLTMDDLGTLKKDGFSIAFPEKYDTQKQKVGGGMDLTMYTAELRGGDEAFLASMFTPPKAAPISLKGAVQGAAANTGGKVEETEKTTIDGMKAMTGRYSVKQKGQTGTAWAAVADVDGSLFQFQYVSKGRDDQEDAPKIFDQIIDSIDFE